MSLLRSLLAWFNPTWVWEEDAARPLIVDLDEHRFSGVGVGDPVEQLSFLGPGKASRFVFAWPRKGIQVLVHDRLIREMGFYFGHPAEPGHGAFAGSFRRGGSPVRLSRESRESGVQSLFGPPYWRDQDEGEILLFYEFPGVEWQMEFDLGGTLKYLQVCLPLLADAGQRTAYGVTKPWPPDWLLG